PGLLRGAPAAPAGERRAGLRQRALDGPGDRPGRAVVVDGGDPRAERRRRPRRARRGRHAAGLGRDHPRPQALAGSRPGSRAPRFRETSLTERPGCQYVRPPRRRAPMRSTACPVVLGLLLAATPGGAAVIRV